MKSRTFTRARLNVTESVYKTLLERFGEPINSPKATVGAVDNGPQGKALWNDEPKKDREWSDPDVVNETFDDIDESETCQCNNDMMPENIDEVTPPGKEKMVKALKKEPGVDNPWAVAWSAYNKEHKK